MSTNSLDYQRFSAIVSGIVDRKVFAVAMGITTGSGFLQELVTTAQGHANAAQGYSNLAAGSASTADTAAATSLIVWNQFTSTYCGLRTTDPLLSSQGNPINIGAVYIRSTDSRIRFVESKNGSGVPQWKDVTFAVDPTTINDAAAGLFLSLNTLNSQTVKSPVVFQSAVTSPRVSSWTTQQLVTAIDVNDRITTINSAISAETTRATTAEGTLTTSKVNKAGDTLSGFLTLHANPTASFHAASKIYVDNSITTYVDTAISASAILAKVVTVDGAGSGLDADLLDGQEGSYYNNIPARLGYTPLNKAGDTMTGFLTLHASPVNGMHPATKAYVDAAALSATIGYTAVNIAGDTMTGPLTLSGAPTSNGHATTKVYVDTLVTSGAIMTKVLANDGSGSGLDADLLDGQDGTYYTNVVARLGYTPVNRAGDNLSGYLNLHALPTADNHAASKLYIDQLVTPTALMTKILANDGAGSQLDSDFLDGQDSSYYTNITARLGFTPVNRAGDTLTGFLNLHANPTASAHAVNKAYLDSVTTASAELARMVTVDGSGSGLDADLLDGQEGVFYARPGKIEIFAMNTPPTGYLECNGAAVSRTTYAALFAAIGTTWGGGNGSTTFNLPDTRGEFIRGWDNGRGVDSGRAFASAQGFLLQSHNHSASTGASGDHSHTLNGGYSMSQFGYDGGDYGAAAGASVSNVTSTTGAHIHDVTVDNTGGNETRPRNLAFLICIKF